MLVISRLRTLRYSTTTLLLLLAVLHILAANTRVMAENTSMVGNINEGRNGSEDIGNNAQDTLNGQRLLQAPSLETDKETHKLDVSSGKASIELGPVVVNEDGG